MRLNEWLALFKRHRQLKIFHLNHLRLFTQMKDPTLKVALERLTRKEILQRICRGTYANPFNPPTLEEISAEIYKPSYISLEAALHRHGILSQIPYALTCITPRLTRSFRTPFGPIQYRQVKGEFFFGFVQEAGYWMAEPEKAVADFLYLNRLIRPQALQGMVAEFNLKPLSRPRLRSYAKRMRVPLPHRL